MRANRSVRVALATLVALMALVVPATAATAQSYPSTPTLTVDQTVVPPCTTVTLTVGGTVVGTVTTDDQGNYTFTYTVSCSEVDGAVLTFTASDGTNVLSVAVTIEAAAVTSTTAAGTLPRTGASDTTMLLIRVSIVLVAVGGILVLATSRRKRNHASH
jgi:hypothetical protein